MRASLLRFKDVYAHLTPFERKELLRLLLRRAEVGDRQIVGDLPRGGARYGDAPEPFTL